MIRLTKGDEPDVLLANKASWTTEYLAGDDKRRYAHGDIRAALRDETQRKCAYCEGHIEHVSYSHVEHIRPKKKFPAEVVEWTNLTLGCAVCNTNKGDHYDADCLLLNPYADEPDEHLAWFGPMVMEVTPDRGRSTIAKLDLNRPELLYKRAERIRQAKDLLTMIAGAPASVATAVRQDLDAMSLSKAEYSAAVRAWLATEAPAELRPAS